MELLKDYLASRVIARGKQLDDYTKIYFKTNEDLVTSYLDTDFQNKDVLSVLASSDQVFTARMLGAKRVDSFDKNPLVLYYYYLRSWTIMYMNQLYPTQILDNDYHFLLELLKRVDAKTDEERHALEFWNEHLINSTDLSKLFFEDTREGKTLFSNPSDLLNVSSDSIQFKDFNLFEKIDSNDSYDIIMISNIIEWARSNEQKITCVRDNLSRLLNQDGIVLCTGLLNRYPEKKLREREIFDSSFDFINYGNMSYAYRKR